MYRGITIRTLVGFIVTFLFLGLCNSARAQINHYLPSTNPQLVFEVMKPNLSDVQGVKTLSSVWFFNANLPLGESRMVFLSEIPISYYDYEVDPFFGSFESQLLFGNILVGLEFRGDEELIGGFGHLGVRLPTASEENFSATIYGLFTDYDRFETFIPNQLSILGGGGWRLRFSEASTSNSQLHIGFTGLALIPTEGGGDSEVFAKYYGQFWYLSQFVGLGFGLSGIMLLTESGLEFGERVENQITFNFQYRANSVKPGAFLRVPLGDEIKQLVDFVAGINLTVDLE